MPLVLAVETPKSTPLILLPESAVKVSKNPVHPAAVRRSLSKAVPWLVTLSVIAALAADDDMSDAVNPAIAGRAAAPMRAARLEPRCIFVPIIHSPSKWDRIIFDPDPLN